MHLKKKLLTVLVRIQLHPGKGVELRRWGQLVPLGVLKKKVKKWPKKCFFHKTCFFWYTRQKTKLFLLVSRKVKMNQWKITKKKLFFSHFPLNVVFRWFSRTRIKPTIVFFIFHGFSFFFQKHLPFEYVPSVTTIFVPFHREQIEHQIDVVFWVLKLIVSD